MAVVQTLTVSGAAGIAITNAPPTESTDFHFPEKGLAFPDFEMRLALVPDSDDVPGSLSNAATLGLGSLPLVIEVHGTSLADFQVNRRKIEAAFSQVGETITIDLGGESEAYPFLPTWPKWGAIDSGELAALIISATLAVPVNPMEA